MAQERLPSEAPAEENPARSQVFTDVAQGLVLTRWAAGELAALWVRGLARWAWLAAGVGVVLALVSIPVDPGWPLVVAAVVVLLGAGAFRVALAVVGVVLRRLALPRRARHLRAYAVAARHRLRDEMEASGVPVSIRHAIGFLWALVRGRRPHARVTGDLGGFTRRLVDAAEVAHLRARLAEAVGTRAEETTAGPDPSADDHRG